jgi:ABC-type lipoprotein release transport system permease subunit
MMPQMGIDGAVLKSSKKKEEESKENIPDDSNSDSDGSEHNIFGSNQVVLSKEMRQNLGLGEDSHR